MDEETFTDEELEELFINAHFLLFNLFKLHPELKLTLTYVTIVLTELYRQSGHEVTDEWLESQMIKVRDKFIHKFDKFQKGYGNGTG